MLFTRLIKKYITNEELEINHRLVNMILMAGIVVLPICLIFDLIMGAASETFIPLSLLFVTFAMSFYIANKRDKFQIACIILTFFSSDFLIPYLYFRGGGRNSSMPAWFILSAVFVWLLVKGWPCIAIFISNILVYSLVFWIEYHHPEYVVRLADTGSEYLDIAAGIFLIIAMLGIIYKIQNRLYEKKKQQLEEKEAELTETNRRLEQLSEAKSMFLASMSHEIRTPINAIVGMNEMVLRKSKDEDIIDYAENIERASGTLLSLINDILDFSKIESGLMEILPDEYEPFSVLNDCYTLLEMRAKDKGLQLELINDPSIPSRLYGDEVRIRQILINLLTNAVKYTEKGTITLRTECEESAGDGEVVLSFSVIDSGQGIPEEAMEHLFDSYTRFDEKKNRKIEGTGLGLAITKQLIDLMNATIDVQSKLGEGSAFTVKIPQKVLSKEPMGDFLEKRKNRSAAISGHFAGFTAKGAKILLTDDINMNLKVITALLKDTEIEIDTATSGRECLEKYEKNHYDILFLDHMMPEMDGIETLKFLKETKRYKEEHTPVIALTANAMLGAEKIYLDTGFDDYLTKPAKGADLEAMILKHLPENIKPDMHSPA
ncbi:MAG: response regulator [Lachnospiraceae bacterium]|nr:response regulator [Lachnospiraceae bacterium]